MVCYKSRTHFIIKAHDEPKTITYPATGITVWYVTGQRWVAKKKAWTKQITVHTLGKMLIKVPNPEENQ